MSSFFSPRSCSRPRRDRPRSAPGGGRDVPVGYQVLKAGSGSFIIFYPPRFAKLARETGALLEESSGEIARELGLESIDPIRVIIASDMKAFELLHGGAIPEWGIAFADVEARFSASTSTLSPASRAISRSSFVTSSRTFSSPNGSAA